MTTRATAAEAWAARERSLTTAFKAVREQRDKARVQAEQFGKQVADVNEALLNAEADRERLAQWIEANVQASAVMRHNDGAWFVVT